MSFKFSQIETIRSLKLVFKANTRKINLANDQVVETQGQLRDVPVMVENIQTKANPHIMNDLSYDLILGREWCEANGVVIDFNKKKIYLLSPQIVIEDGENINVMGDDETEPSLLAQTETAQLNQEITIKPYHEALVTIRSSRSIRTSYL